MNSLFDNLENRFKLDKPVRLIELFAGIGAQAKALENLGIDFEHYRVCEIDKYAVASYNAIHGTNFEISDITKLSSNDLGIVDTNTYIYILTYSFPCQDLSLAGKQKGMKKGTQTRSGLLWEVERLLKGCKELPQVLLMENVPQVHSFKNYEDFKDWQNFLSNLGYQNTWADLNAKNYGIPQNRNRTFMVSILGNSFYEFPEPFPLKLKLGDYLEPVVDEKYYLSAKLIDCFTDMKNRNGFLRGMQFTPKFAIKDKIARTITTKAGSGPCDNYIVEPVITLDGKVIVPQATKDGYAIAEIGDGIYTNRCISKRGVVQKDKIPTLKTSGNDIVVVVTKDSENYIQWEQKGCFDIECRAYKEDKVSGALNTYGHMKVLTNDVAIRRLTPLECFRLMGFEDEDFEKASKVNSNTQLYKQAGNSIVVNVLMEIFRKMV